MTDQRHEHRTMPTPARGVPVDNILDAACLVVTAALMTVVAAGGHTAIRPASAVAFTLFAPGWATVTNWPAMAQRSRVAASVLLSITILTLVATVTLWLHFWHPYGVLEVEGAFVIAAVVIGLLRRNRSASRDRLGGP